jgi:hypothetical protein
MLMGIVNHIAGAAVASGAAASGGVAATGSGTIAVATITSSAPGIMGVLGFTTTTVVALPVAGIAAAAGIVGYGLYKGASYARKKRS